MTFQLLGCRFVTMCFAGRLVIAESTIFIALMRVNENSGLERFQHQFEYTLKVAAVGVAEMAPGPSCSRGGEVIAGLTYATGRLEHLFHD